MSAESSVLKSVYFMLSSGISAADASRELSSKIKDAKMSEKLFVISDLIVNEGYSFASAMEQVGMCLNYMPVLKVGEKTGRLNQILKDMLESIDDIEKIQKKVKSSLYYPVGVIFFSILVGYGLTIVLEKLLIGLAMPSTKSLPAYKFGWWIVRNKNFIFPCYISLIAGFGFMVFKNAHRVPVIKQVYNKMSIGQALKVTALAMSSGLPASKAFELASQTLRGYWRTTMETIAEEAEMKNIYEVIDEMEQNITPESFIVLKAKIRSGNTHEGLDMIGREQMQASIQKLEALAPFVNMFTFLFAATQVMMIMLPLYGVLISFMDKVTSKGGL